MSGCCHEIKGSLCCHVVFVGDLYPVDLPVLHYSELNTGCEEYLSRVKSDGAMPFTLPHGEKVCTTLNYFHGKHTHNILKKIIVYFKIMMTIRFSA